MEDFVARVRSSTILAILSRNLGFIVALAATMILARLLTPEEIGIFSVCAAFVTIAHGLREFGVGNYLIQARELHPDVVSSAFGVYVVMAWGLGILLFSIRFAVADFFQEPGVADVLAVLALNFFIIPFGAVNLAILTRKMRFDLLMLLNFAGAVAHGVAGVTLAYRGLGYMSMAWASVAGTAATVVLAILLCPGRSLWLPTFSRTKEIIVFGSQVSVASMLHKIELGLADFVIGRAVDLSSVGLFSRANGLVGLVREQFLQALNTVVQPAFAQAKRDGQDLLGNYLKSIELLTAVAWPLCGLIAIMPLPIIRLMFGGQWDAAAPIASVLAVAAAISVLESMVPSVLLSVGEPRRMMLAQLWAVLVHATAVVAAVRWGLIAVAWAFVISATGRFLIHQYYLSIVAGGSLLSVLLRIWRSLALTVFTIAPVWIIEEMGIATLHGPFLAILAAAFAALVTWLAAAHVFHHPISQEISALRSAFFSRMAKRVS